MLRFSNLKSKTATASIVIKGENSDQSNKFYLKRTRDSVGIVFKKFEWDNDHPQTALTLHTNVKYSKTMTPQMH